MSATDRQAALVAAIGAALRADAALATLIGARVYDAPPARAVMPSVTIRLGSARDGSTADTEAQLLAFDLDVWDRYEVGADLSRPRCDRQEPTAVGGIMRDWAGRAGRLREDGGLGGVL